MNLAAPNLPGKGRNGPDDRVFACDDADCRDMTTAGVFFAETHAMSFSGPHAAVASKAKSGTSFVFSGCPHGLAILSVREAGDEVCPEGYQHRTSEIETRHTRQDVI